VVIVREIDRLTRNLTDWNAFEKACVRRGVRLSAYTGGDLDLPCCTGSSSTRFPPARHAVREARSRTLPNATRNGDLAAACRIRLARVAITPRAEAAETSQRRSSPPLRAQAAGVLVRRPPAVRSGARASRKSAASTATAAGSSMRSGKPCPARERRASSAPACRIAARSWSLRCGRALPPCVPVPSRPSRRRCPRVTGRRARGARDGTTPGTVIHSDRPPGLRARQCPPLTPIARPAPAGCRRCR
jgi:hypothetical protein